jgi:hypothetical protein
MATEQTQTEQTQEAQTEQMQEKDERDQAREHTQEKSEREEAGEDQALFGEDELTSFRGRWDEIQAGFVDEPREAVERADALVSDLVERITASFSEARSGLESQWSQGEEASTEDLRVALTRYRAFFQRLLAA